MCIEEPLDLLMRTNEFYPTNTAIYKEIQSNQLIAHEV